MVFRKPYAFFIKNFRLMHIILTICCAYLAIKTSSIVSFLSSYMSSSDLVIGQQIVSGLYSIPMFVMPIFVVIFLTIILVVMFVKEKPKTLYFVNIAIYIMTFILFIHGRSVIASMEKEIVTPRTIKSLYDMEVYALVFQVISIIFLGIRGIGFDIKKFDFSRDLQALDVSSEDNEEFEVSINFDVDDTKRKVKKNIRHLKYTYVEHRLIINSIIAIIVLFTGYSLYKNSRFAVPKYNQGKKFNINNFAITVVDSYLVDTDYNGNELDKNVFIVKLKLECFNKKNKKLITGSFDLIGDDKSYGHVEKYNEEFKDLGTVYYNQDVEGESYYLLTFDIDKDEFKEAKLKVSNILGDGYVFVNLRYHDLTIHKDFDVYDLGEEMSLSDSTSNDINLTINSYDVQEKFKLNYQFCYNDNCVDSVEYLVPDYYNTNYDLALLKLNVDYSSDNSKVSNFFNFLSTFGKVVYVINGEEKEQNIPFKQVISSSVNSKNTYYIEVLKEVYNAESIKLVFDVRNNTYEYNIR